MAKPMTLRLTDEQHAELQAVARVEGVPLSEVVRGALTEHIAARRKDEGFRRRLEAVMERDRELLERLAR
jgi:hypothetical protein